MIKNITLRADEELIRKAKEKARKDKTTLNNEFRLWLEKYIDEKRTAKHYQDIMKKLEYASLKRMPKRKEMNERN